MTPVVFWHYIPGFRKTGPMSRVYLSQAEPGTYLEEVLVVTGKQLSTTQSGKLFIKCFVGDRTRQVAARMWNATQALFNAIPDGGFLRIAGRVENYQDNPQLVIEKFWIVDPQTEVVLEELLPHTTKSIPLMMERLTGLVDSIRNRDLRSLLREFLDDQPLMERLRDAPAAMAFHHAFIGGLLEHTLNAMEVADAVCVFYPGLSRDLVLAGVFLHDIAKTWELTYSAGFGYSDGGHLVGHVVKSAIWIEQKADALARRTGRTLPRELIDVLQHIVLSHHGQPEFGAARVPMTPEAIAVHMIENMDAKLAMSLSATRGDATDGGGNFSEYQKALGIRLYKPDRAPPDDAASAAPTADPLLVVEAESSVRRD